MSALLLSGCATPPGQAPSSIVQTALDRLLPPTFTGKLDIQENVPLYLSITVKGSNLRRENGVWLYDWIEYHRNGPAGTSAHIILGDRP